MKNNPQNQTIWKLESDTLGICYFLPTSAHILITLVIGLQTKKQAFKLQEITVNRIDSIALKCYNNSKLLRTVLEYHQ